MHIRYRTLRFLQIIEDVENIYILRKAHKRACLVVYTVANQRSYSTFAEFEMIIYHMVCHKTTGTVVLWDVKIPCFADLVMPAMHCESMCEDSLFCISCDTCHTL